MSELTEKLSNECIDICFVCETKARKQSLAPHGFVEWVPDPEERSRDHYGAGLWVREGLDKSPLRILSGLGIPGHTIWWWYEDVLFGGIYIRPGAGIEYVRQAMQSPVNTHGKGTVLLGDFNGRSRAWGDRLENTQGTQVMEECIASGMRLVKNIDPGPTFVSIKGQSWIDLIMTTLPELTLSHAAMVKEKIGGSDHHMIWGDITLENPNRDTPAKKRNRIRVEKLDQERWNQATNVIGEEWLRTWEGELITPTQRSIDEADDTLSSQLIAQATGMCGVESTKNKSVKPYDCDELKRCNRDMKQEWERLRKLRNQRGNLEDPEWKVYSELRTKRRNLICKIKEKRNEEFTEAFERKPTAEKVKILTAMRKKRTRVTTRLKWDRESMVAHAEHFQRVFTPRDDPTAINDNINIPYTEEDPPFELEDVKEALSWLPNRKAPGPTGLTNELIRKPGEKLIEAIFTLFTACWRSGLIPTTWTVGHIVPVPKKGDISLITNNRPITLTETLRKVYERVILKELLEGNKNPRNRIHLSIYQGGFRQQRCTVDQVAALQQAILIRRDRLGKPPLIAFLDIKAAYDTTWREKLWGKCAREGMSHHMLRTLRALSDHNKSIVTLNGAASPEINHPIGLWQGTILSPILYAYFIDDLCSRLATLSTWSMNGTPMAAFLYADDIALVADEEAHLRQMLKVCEDFSDEHRFRFAPSKCEVLAKEEAENTESFELYGEPLTFCRHFPYLGITLGPEGIDPKEHFRRRREKGLVASNLIRASGIGYLGANAVSTVLRTVLMPQLEYGLAIVKPTKKILQNLDQVIGQTGKRLLGVSICTSSVKVAWYLEIPKYEDRRRELHASWMDRVERLSDDGQFMVVEAGLTTRDKKYPKSAFRVETGKESELLNALRACSSKREKRQTMTRLRTEENTTTWMNLENQLGAMEGTPGTTRRKLYKALVGRTDLRRGVECAILDRLVGKPFPCKNCGGKVRQGHNHVCWGEDSRICTREGRFLDAAEAVLNFYEKCKGLEVQEIRLALRHMREREPP